jgi:AcrR family transcriptional regulator
MYSSLIPSMCAVSRQECRKAPERRFATKDALVEHVVRREFRRYFEQFLIDIQRAETAADRVVLGFVSSLRAIRGNPLIGGLISAEPDQLVAAMINDGGRTLAPCGGSSRASSAASSARATSRAAWTPISWPS